MYLRPIDRKRRGNSWIWLVLLAGLVVGAVLCVLA